MDDCRRRPLEGTALQDTLHELARASRLAVRLKIDLEQLPTEDVRFGAEPLSKERIQERLDEIARTITKIVILHLKAEPNEWYAANDEIP